MLVKASSAYLSELRDAAGSVWTADSVMACDVKLAMYRSVVIAMIATFSGIRASTGLLLHLVVLRQHGRSVL